MEGRTTSGAARPPPPSRARPQPTQPTPRAERTPVLETNADGSRTRGIPRIGRPRVHPGCRNGHGGNRRERVAATAHAVLVAAVVTDRSAQQAHTEDGRHRIPGEGSAHSERAGG